MRFLGVDLAWGEGTDKKAANETGVVALEADGTIIEAGWTVGIEKTRAWINELAGPDTLLFVDAPLIVTNPAGTMRACERQVGQRYGRWKVSANASNLGSERHAGLALRELLEADGWQYDDGFAGPPQDGRVMSECYPYTALVGVAELGYDEERPTYKRKPDAIPTAEWRPLRAEVADGLISRLGNLRDADPPLDLAGHAVARRLLEEPSPTVDRDYKHREDLIDACVAAWSAALWHRHGTERCQVLGDETEPQPRASIIAPSRPEQRAGAAKPRKTRARASKKMRSFIEIAMPARFDLECLDGDGAWTHWGRYEARLFDRLDDGSYLCAGHGGSPTYLRCLRQDGQVIYVLDGSGEPFTYRVVKL